MFQLIPKPKVEAPAPKLIEPIPYELRETKKRICVFDTETDPFEYGVAVKPFTCGFYDGETYVDFVGADCVAQFFDYLEQRTLKGEQLCIYTHNGGNFDFYFMLDFVDRGTAPFIINGRLARLYMQNQEFRDSYSLIPVALSAYEKTEIDYDKFKEGVRDQYMDEIRAYQRDDCLFLFDLVREANAMFGDKLTMASVALPTLRSFHGFESMKEKTDQALRPFYFGGRNECFEVGELKGKWKVYDVNSMYPFVMATALHPISNTPRYQDKITPDTDFAHIRAWSNGALAMRKDDGGLSFPIGNGDFYASIHEINAGLDTGTLRISKVHYAITFDQKTSFAEFVNHFYSLRQKARKDGDKIRLLYYKLVLNSSYGKLAQDPRRYENYLFDPDDIPQPLQCAECDKETPRNDWCDDCKLGATSPFGWYPHTIREGAIIYARPSLNVSRFGFYNVATAASITGAARAYLLRGLVGATRPIYCDTDSIICEALGAENKLSSDELGAWKLEEEGDRCCIAGKKLYAVFNAGLPIKSASKGVKLTPDEIARVCMGETVEYANPVPKFHLDGSIDFTTRKINRTGGLP